MEELKITYIAYKKDNLRFAYNSVHFLFNCTHLAHIFSKIECTIAHSAHRGSTENYRINSVVVKWATGKLFIRKICISHLIIILLMLKFNMNLTFVTCKIYYVDHFCPFLAPPLFGIENTQSNQP